MLRLVPLLVVAVLLAGCAPSDPGPPPRHVVGFGFETLVGDTDWAGVVERLDEAHVDEVSLAVGRLDWLAYPPDTVGRPSGPVRESGRDFVADALRALEPWRAADPARTVTLTIDALIPGLIADEPGWAAVDADGRPSADFASITALEGRIGDDLVALTGDLVARYQPDEVSITELLIDHSFGADDLESFRAHSGHSDWPRRTDGEIDTADPQIAAWRSDAVTRLVGRMADVSRSAGVPFAMDVRVNWKDPARGRPESGHDYAALLGAADRLTLWCYTSLGGVAPEEVGVLPAALAAAGMDTDRMVFSVGMWTSEDTEAISPDHLSRALGAAEGSGAAAVGITPESLLTPAHWQVLQSIWG